jgi:hypothetical protein
MSGPHQRRLGAPIWLLIGVGMLIVLGANAHLVYVATATQPDCVPHVRSGENAAGSFSAAKSACTPAPPRTPGGRS